MSDKTGAKARDRKNQTKSQMPAVAGIIYAVALLLLLLPVYEWISNATYFYTETQNYPMLLLNLPARLFALLGFMLMFYQFVLGIRIPLFEKVFKRATNIKRHRTLGKVGFILLLLHGLMLMGYDYVVANQLLFDFYRVLGMTALGLLIIAVIAAWFFKPLKLPRKAWKTIHLLAYVVFPLGFEHGRNLGTEYATGQWTVQYLFNGLFVVFCILVLYRLGTYVMELQKKRKAAA